jgi:hypothetical protein
MMRGVIFILFMVESGLLDYGSQFILLLVSTISYT